MNSPLLSLFFSEAIPVTNTCFTLSSFLKGSLATGIKISLYPEVYSCSQIQQCKTHEKGFALYKVGVHHVNLVEFICGKNIFHKAN